MKEAIYYNKDIYKYQFTQINTTFILVKDQN